MVNRHRFAKWLQVSDTKWEIATLLAGMQPKKHLCDIKARGYLSCAEVIGKVPCGGSIAEVQRTAQGPPTR